MNVLLLGNGFDLYHSLPTKYENFLHTAEYLLKADISTIKTIADVFGNESLQNQDEFIKFCYIEHEQAYKSTLIDEEKINEIKKICRDNIWFKYFLKSLNKDIGWIDFEREVAEAICAFFEFFKQNSIKFTFDFVNSSNVLYKYILLNLDFFFKKVDSSGHIGKQYYEVIPKYKIEKPTGTKHFVVNKEKIIAVLDKQLKELAQALQLYLYIFVESTIDSSLAYNSITKCEALSYIDYVVTFNYTNSYEKIYGEGKVWHLHGNINDSIILGVNPNKYDKLESIDTSFVSFKKYYLRTLKETDIEYRSFISEIDWKYDNVSVITMGHSLDVTDRDIIEELFKKASDIVILYHNKDAKARYIAKIIEMFGMEGLEKLRFKHNLKFISLGDDFKEFKSRIYNSSEKGVLEANSRLFVDIDIDPI